MVLHLELRFDFVSVRCNEINALLDDVNSGYVTVQQI